MTVEDEVRAASQRFYDALNKTVNGDAKAMDEVWEHGDGTSAMNSMGACETGWTKVAETYQEVASMASEGRMELKERRLRIFGDVALETGIEEVGCKLCGQLVEGQVRVTNLYRHTDQGWKIIHHHADISPSMEEAAKAS